MKSSKSQIHAKIHKIPHIRFHQERKLTSFAGIVIFQALFYRLKLKARLQKCFRHLNKNAIFGHATIVLMLIVHLILGFRRLRGLDYYRDDPLIARVVGLRMLPDVSTVCRTLATADERAVGNMRSFLRQLVIERLQTEGLSRLTIDFDGSVLSTKRHAEDSAVGYNKKKKGARSYYELFCTIAQTGQFFDLLHRPGNVHDSNGASDFIDDCLSEVKRHLPGVQLESRTDSAFFNQQVIGKLEKHGVEFSCSVPFERFVELKQLVEERRRWRKLDERWSFFESYWKPKCWDERYRLLFLRQRRASQHKGPLQLDLFEPKDYVYEYKVVATNKTQGAKNVLFFHNGRGSQEKLFGDAKQDVALEVIATRKKDANQIFTLSSMLAHNLARELQMTTFPAERSTCFKRPALWNFLSLGTIRQHLLHKAGYLTCPQGELTLTMNANESVQTETMRYLEALRDAA